MPQTFNIAAGWTQEMGPFTLLKNGAALDLNGMDVDLVLRPVGESDLTLAGTTRIDDDPTTGKVYFTPDAADLSAGTHDPYRQLQMRWKVQDSGGKFAFFPSGEPDYLRVWKA